MLGVDTQTMTFIHFQMLWFVSAIRSLNQTLTIKKGTQLFIGDNDEMLWVEEKSLPKKPRAVRELYQFAVIKNGRYGCPPTFNRLTTSWYVNHSEKPNTKRTENYDFIALENIKPGEELTVDYSTYNDPQALDFKKQPHMRRLPRSPKRLRKI